MLDERLHVESFQGLKNFQNNFYMNAIIQCLRGCKLNTLELKDHANWFKHMIALISKNKVDSNDLLAFMNEFFKDQNKSFEFEKHNFMQSIQGDAREFLIYGKFFFLLEQKKHKIKGKTRLFNQN